MLVSMDLFIVCTSVIPKATYVLVYDRNVQIFCRLPFCCLSTLFCLLKFQNLELSHYLSLHVREIQVIFQITFIDFLCPGSVLCVVGSFNILLGSAIFQ